MLERRDTFSWQAAPQANRVVRDMASELLRFFRFLGRDDSKYKREPGMLSAAANNPI